MNSKKVFSYASIFLGVVLILVIIFLFINSRIIKCNSEEHERLTNTTKCYYFGESCNVDETTFTLDEKSACSYEGKRLLSGKAGIYIVISVISLWVIMFVIYLVMILMKGKSRDLFNKKDFVPVKRAKEIVMEVFSEVMKILVIDKTLKESAFKWEDSEPFVKNKEHFWKTQVEVLEGISPGIYTIYTSLSRGEDWIRNQMYRIRKMTYDEYKIHRDMPLNVPESIQERAFETLAEKNPEKAEELQEQMAEKDIMSSKRESLYQENPQEQMMPMAPQYRRQYRKPYKPYNYRRYV
jgi:uncharacterized membrane protein